MKNTPDKTIILVAGALLLATATLASAQTSAAPTAAAAAPKQDLGAAMQNPIGAIYSLPFEVTTDFGADNGDATFLQFQPVYPFSLGEWNMVNRTIIPFIDAPGGRPGQPGNPSPEMGPRASGLGDITHMTFFSPAKAKNGLVWGVGPGFTIPTASEDVLGSGKWNLGPSFVVLKISKPWVVGCLVGNMWSIAGDSDRADVNQMMFQPFATYNMQGGWFLTTSPIMTANWKASSGERWMIPLGGGMGRQFKLGKIPSQFMVQYFYNVEKPTGAPDGSLRFTFQMAFPK